MSTTPGSTNPAPEAREHTDPSRQDPSATDPMADEKVRLQLAIFEVTRDAGGKSLDEIQDMLRSAFQRHGVETPPGTWVESVASSAFYGEPYIVDLSAAVIADQIVPAPNEEVRQRLASRRELRDEQLPPGIFPDASEWELSPHEVTPARPERAGRGAFRAALASPAGASRQLLAAAGLAAAVLAALVVMRASRRPSRARGTS